MKGAGSSSRRRPGSPGTRAAERELAFHLECDADEYAVATSDPLALASAICKVATAAPVELTPLGGRGRAAVRLSRLVDGAPSSAHDAGSVEHCSD